MALPNAGYRLDRLGTAWVLLESPGQVHLSVNPSGDAKKLMRTEAEDSGLELCSGQQICNGRLEGNRSLAAYLC